jgi:hypothetical protein
VRPDNVEIKATVDGTHVGAGIQAFGLSAEGRNRRIYFCEDVSPVAPLATPLLDSGVVIRLRENDGRKDDSTIKLRPCRGSQLADPWFRSATGDSHIRVEIDWAGTRRVLAASFEVELARGAIAAARDSQDPLGDLLVDEQRRFLADCSNARINIDALTVLPPVIGTRWRSQTAPPDPAFEIVAERWTVTDAMTFLEFSIRVPMGEADRAKREFEKLLFDRGLRVEAAQETKTKRVLEHLVAQVAS